jgi:hypothetical protein
VLTATALTVLCISTKQNWRFYLARFSDAHGPCKQDGLEPEPPAIYGPLEGTFGLKVVLVVLACSCVFLFCVFYLFTPLETRSCNGV